MQENGKCRDNSYGPCNSLGNATNACKDRHGLFNGIWHNTCDGPPPYKLCRNLEDGASAESCIYKQEQEEM